MVTKDTIKYRKHGDVAAAREIRSIIGEDNEAERIKIQRRELKLKEKKQEPEGSNGIMNALIEGLKDDIHE